jgi:hypothetical protein
MGGQRIGRPGACDSAEHEELAIRRDGMSGNRLFDIGPAEPLDPLALQAPLALVGEVSDDVGASLIMAAGSLHPDFGSGVHLFHQHRDELLERRGIERIHRKQGRHAQRDRCCIASLCHQLRR